MSYTPRRRKFHTTRKNYSVIAKLEKEMKINDKFQIMMNSLTLEEVIAVKLELAAKASGGSIYGIPVWFSIRDLVKDACLKFALSATRTKMEAARFLGLNSKSFGVYMTKYKIEHYFQDSSNDDAEESTSPRQNFP